MTGKAEGNGIAFTVDKNLCGEMASLVGFAAAILFWPETGRDIT